MLLASFLPVDLLLDSLQPDLVPVVAPVQSDEGPGEGVVHQTGDVHRVGVGAPSYHHQLPEILSQD